MTEERLPLAELLAKAGDGDFLRGVAEAVVQLLMETDVEGLIGAGRHERSGDRTTYRNGYRDRTLDTRLDQPAAVLACVKPAARRLRRWPAARLDPGCAPRRGDVWPGRRNGARPNRETPPRWAWRHQRTPLLSGGKSGRRSLAVEPQHGINVEQTGLKPLRLAA